MTSREIVSEIILTHSEHPSDTDIDYWTDKLDALIADEVAEALEVEQGEYSNSKKF